jgi:hypothetical protein
MSHAAMHTRNLHSEMLLGRSLFKTNSEMGFKQSESVKAPQNMKKTTTMSSSNWSIRFQMPPARKIASLVKYPG